jgi:acyl-coenzyme A thioesterase PaaI-like protein
MNANHIHSVKEGKVIAIATISKPNGIYLDVSIKFAAPNEHAVSPNAKLAPPCRLK